METMYKKADELVFKLQCSISWTYARPKLNRKCQKEKMWKKKLFQIGELVLVPENVPSFHSSSLESV